MTKKTKTTKHAHKIERIQASELVPYEHNARTHSKEQIQKIADSIQAYGFNNPILIDSETGVIAGHGRLAAAQLLELETVPCIKLGHLSDAEKRAYIIADNRLAEIGTGWDEDILRAEIEALANAEIELSIFDLDEILEAENVINEADEIIHEQSLQLEPSKEYVLIMAKDLAEWDEIIEYFKLKKVRRGGYKKGSPFEALRIERVLTFDRVKEAVKKC